MANTYPIERAMQLLALGYNITPNRGKACHIPGWNTPAYVADVLTAGPKGTPAERWKARFSEYPTIGVRIDRGRAMLDIDVDDPLTNQLLERIAVIAPEVHARAPTRYGGGTHKVALIAQTDVTPGEVGKLRSHRYRRPDDGVEQHHCVEIFLSSPDNDVCKHQFGAYGAHTIGVRDYEWCEEIPPLHMVAPRDLPLLTKAAANQILAAFERLADAAGWVRLGTDAGAADAAFIHSIDEETRFELADGSEVDYAELCDRYTPGDDLRCSSSFHGNAGSNRNKCRVGEIRALGGVVGVWDNEEAAWYAPKLVDTAALGQELKAWAAENYTGESMFVTTFSYQDFYAYLPEHKYIYAPLGTLWPQASVNARLAKVGPLKASMWLDQNRHVEQMTWVPGEPVEIVDRLFADGGWIRRPGSRGFNLYRPPAAPKAGMGDAKLWRRHVERIYPDEAEHVEQWCAQRVQRPAEKINHALVLGGNQGTGKDTLLAPLKHAVGPWNFSEVGPQQLLERFNGFLKSVVLRISEARDLGEYNRYAFYNHTKSIIAAPPDALLVDEKNRHAYYIPNVCGVVITLNEKDSLYLPPDDRRHFVAWSNATKEDTDLDTEYWDRIWHWYANGGLDAVACHLAGLDLSRFHAQKPPRQTEGFRTMMNLSRMPEDAEMADVLDALRRPDAVTLEDVAGCAFDTKRADFGHYLTDRRNARKFIFRFAACGYSPVDNPDAKDGLWAIAGKRQVIYARDEGLGGSGIKAAQMRAAEAAEVSTTSKWYPGVVK